MNWWIECSSFFSRPRVEVEKRRSWTPANAKQAEDSILSNPTDRRITSAAVTWLIHCFSQFRTKFPQISRVTRMDARFREDNSPRLPQRHAKDNLGQILA